MDAENLRPDIQFQFTPLREGRPSNAAASKVAAEFQFTPLREGRPSMRGGPGIRSIFQFTPLREGRPQAAQQPPQV